MLENDIFLEYNNFGCSNWFFLCYFNFFPNVRGKSKLYHEMKNETWNKQCKLLHSKNEANFEEICTGHFFKHQPLISKE